MVKPAYINGEPLPIDKATYDKTLEFFEILLKMLHPFMPFITEELWQHLYDRKDGESIMKVSLKLDAPTKADEELAAQIENVKQIVSGVRMVRNQKNIAPKEQLDLQVVSKNDYAAFDAVTIKMANLKSINVVTEKDATASAFMVGTDEFAVPGVEFYSKRLTAMKKKADESGKPDLNILFIYNMPFRAMAKMTGGAVSMDMVDGIVDLVNGHFFGGLGKIISGYFRNSKLNKQYESRIKK